MAGYWGQRVLSVHSSERERRRGRLWMMAGTCEQGVAVEEEKD